MSNLIADLAIVALASWGDVVISTVIPRAAKAQWGSRVTFYVSSACAGAVRGNPDIDDLVIITATKDEAWALQDGVIAQARLKHQLVVAPWPGFRPRENWDAIPATGRPNFMWAYARAAQEIGLDVPMSDQGMMTIYLYPNAAERQRAATFLAGQGRERPNLLMEIRGDSGQSYWNDYWTEVVLGRLMRHYHGELNVWVSNGGPEPPVITMIKQAWPGRTSYLNEYSLREISVLANHADIFVGCSSGTSNAIQTHLVRPVPLWFEAVNDPVWASFPLRPEGRHSAYAKTIYYGGDPSEFAELIVRGIAADGN